MSVVKTCDFKGIIECQVFVDEGIEYVDISLLGKKQEELKKDSNNVHQPFCVLQKG